MKVGVLLGLVAVAIICVAPNCQLLGRKESSLALNLFGSSIVFPVYGNVFPMGFYYVQLNIGHPPKPYFLDPDTGSDLTWLQCDAPCVQCTKQRHPFYQPENNLLACNDSICVSFYGLRKPNCTIPEQCDYEVQYADHGSSLGILVRDTFQLNLIDGVKLDQSLAFGCGYDQLSSGSFYPPLDGVLGLGHGNSSILSQLHDQNVVRNVIGHCFSSRGGGFLFLGDTLYDSSRVVWTAMSRDLSVHYSPGYAELILTEKTPAIKNLLTIFDSGCSFTYFNSHAYKALISSIREDLRQTPLEEAPEDGTLPLCWKGRKSFSSLRDVKKYFQTFALSFENKGKSKTKFDLPPQSYLLITKEGNVCLGILNGSEIGLQNQNIIGDISMQDNLIIYDNEKEVIGWVTANCEKIPKPRRFGH